MSLLPIIFSYFNSSNSQLKHLFREFLLSSQILFPSALSYWVVEGEDQRRVSEFLDPTTLTCLSRGYKIHFMGYNFVLSIGFTGTTASAAWDWDSASNSKSWQCYGKRMVNKGIWKRNSWTHGLSYDNLLKEGQAEQSNKSIAKAKACQERLKQCLEKLELFFKNGICPFQKLFLGPDCVQLLEVVIT